eukprot:CAMPEP_0170782852 /NCGR_PEP_ID=MMETSP0733-20121128/15150_1 /TAXON_ID=186038 /ORGANISM="Fragilariopsis kerguelensis, Strain L26-C5" /LENGTH=761 /DNA_ID=CAMNT_0011127379 /DNA_START=364 /DNA_END=2649 /DNA_ORIENTATION=+
MKHKLEQDFTRAMFADGKIMNAKRKQQETQRKRKVMDKLMKAATPRHLSNNYNNNNANSEYSFEDSYEWMNPVYQQMMEDGVFDLTARSFKYSGCAAIKAFDPEQATQNGNPMVVDTYAVFRLCPEDSCNKYSLTGCGKNYGEYVVEMSTYLEFMLEFYESHYGAYCEYCYPCDYTYQVMKRQTQGNCYETMNIREYTEQQETQQLAWADYYQQNFGDMSEYTKAKEEYQQEMTEQMNNANQQQQAQSWGQSYANSNNGYANSNNGYNRKLDGGYYSDYVAYANGDDSTNNGQDNANSAYSYAANNAGSGNYNSIYGNQQQQNTNGYTNANGYGDSLYGWMNGGQANGQSYYNMMNQKNDQQQYGYYNEYGVYVDLCMSDADGYTDSSGREYDISCDEYESKMMICTDGSLCDYCEFAVDQQYMPCDEYVCKDYYTYCSELYEPNYKKMYNDDYQQQQNNDDYQYYGEQQYQYKYRNNNGGYEYYEYDYTEQTEQNELYQFLECTEYVNEYDQQYFVGPHCASDHYTISLGVFADENCVEYLGETISLSKVLGYGYDEESFFHLPHECISCDGAQQFDEEEERYSEMYMGQGVYGNYIEAPNAEFDDIVAMCAALFERSAQCNIHMNNYEMMAKYMENLDAEFEQRYCNFVDNIVYGSYDESGEIKLRADSFDLSDWRNPEQYKKMKMPAGQAVGLALSILLVVALSALAFVTQRSLTRRSTPWKPKRLSKMDQDPSAIEQEDAGIYMGQSRSGPVDPPLI